MFTDFLTTAIHTILYERGLYPATSFLRARKYRFPVRQSWHPRVCAWVADAVAAVEAQLARGVVRLVALVVHGPDARALERFVFDTAAFPAVQPRERLVPFLRKRGRDDEGDADAEGGGGGSVGGGDAQAADGPAPPRSTVVDLEEQFRAVFARLTACGAALGPLPPGSTFTLAVELKDEVSPPIGHPQPWIPAPPGEQKRRWDGSGEEDEDDGDDGESLAKHRGNVDNGRTMPVRAVEAGEMAFEMWIEESAAKVKIREKKKARQEPEGSDCEY
ncbi:DNA-binding protein [Lineolata rhizophorae]|uniref:DNA-binding protein n=1 Tax=Lineolata rhizophorae TaxID=578093 RepID=A0A6A6PAI8_9PEZI|nr:DNA-binding protein [Lineolata rhizophorae]